MQLQKRDAPLTRMNCRSPLQYSLFIQLQRRDTTSAGAAAPANSGLDIGGNVIESAKQSPIFSVTGDVEKNNIFQQFGLTPDDPMIDRTEFSNDRTEFSQTV